MVKVRTSKYIDVSELSEEAHDIYREFSCDCGIGNGQPWNYQVGELGDDSVIEGYVGVEKAKRLDDLLKEETGLKDGDIIDLIFSW